MNILLFLLCINFYCNSQSAADEFTLDAMTLSDSKRKTPSANIFTNIQMRQMDPEKYHQAAMQNVKDKFLEKYRKDPLNPDNKKWPVSISMKEFAQNNSCGAVRTRMIRENREVIITEFIDQNALVLFNAQNTDRRIRQEPPFSPEEQFTLLRRPFITSLNNAEAYTIYTVTIYNPSGIFLYVPQLIANEELFNTKTTCLNFANTGIMTITPSDYTYRFPNVSCIALPIETPDHILQENIVQNPGITFLLGGQDPIPDNLHLPITPLAQGEVSPFSSITDAIYQGPEFDHIRNVIL